MIAILSPSKTLDFITKIPAPHTQPFFLKEAAGQIKDLKKLSPEKIAKMMHISAKLAELNHQRYQDFHTPFTLKNSKQAILAFQGDVYDDVEIENYTPENFQFAQSHIRIMSGLYGLLKPLDLIQPYRLEMKYRTDFWKDKLTQALNEEFSTQTNKYLINLASNEYSKPVNFKKLEAKIIQVDFKENKEGKLKNIALYSKIARGTMANFIIKHNIDTPEGLKDFTDRNYKFNKKLSTEEHLIFVR